MRILKYLAVAVESIQAHRLRAMLTMLGIVIGIAAVLVTVGIGSGSAASITERIESSGANLLTVSAGSRGAAASTLTLADAQVLMDRQTFPDLVLVSPQYQSNATLTYGASEGTYQVVGATETYVTVRNRHLAAGEFFTADQVAENATVVVLGSTVASDLFGGQDAVGQDIRINDALFQVIGVLKSTGGSGFGSSDNQAFVPIGVAQGRLFNAGRYRGSHLITSMSIQVANKEQLDAAALQVEQVLRLRHGLGAGDNNDFTVANQADLLEVASDVSGTLTALLGGIGAVSLVVGGIGIMNIMLVSVTERTREIGLRKALGAHDSDILLQFLVEALVLCAFGGVIGIGLSYGFARLVGMVPGLAFRIIIEPWAVGLAIVVSTTSGFVFGLYPALRATRLDPIEALRYE
jgi:putative ABC transport system permease protein